MSTEKYYGEAPLQERGDDAAGIAKPEGACRALDHCHARVSCCPESVRRGIGFSTTSEQSKTSGVLFMESGEAPAEIGRITRDLETLAADPEKAGSWLAGAMEASWGVAESTVRTYRSSATSSLNANSVIANDLAKRDHAATTSHASCGAPTRSSRALTSQWRLSARIWPASVTRSGSSSPSQS